ncbi:FAD-dependent oxidoreductase [Candidatus Acetothermia bacterium]|jgi:NADPH-dependent 2,4-dienoyl-CoA reductase/sulfur reductase-like enzyme|nr:FAD-dependent oxidoreductase [Candidatus Acetothermia bacterium]MCI2427570.1 FAD-dependent oxidoreductase [Candidatus Acetothermia bacterium]MCI2428240.1 FAD-dependent oxidoreductase [Candidatus Acetothermia bacterium]
MANKIDVAVIGGGPAGLAAAVAAHEAGADVSLIDRNHDLGGILNQCIHDGFGIHLFGTSLTGPEFAQRYIQQVQKRGVEIMTSTSVTQLTSDRQLICSSRGIRRQLEARAVVLAMGCRERTRGMLMIPGDRPAGIYAAGVAQNLLNEQNILVGRKVVILGSGDVGLIMARSLTWEGATVLAVIEKLPYPSGLPRNIVQCLEDYDIPLYLTHTVKSIHGRNRIEAVTVAQTDSAGNPITGSEFSLACDTLLLSVGLIPENELSRGAGVVIDHRTNGAIVDDCYMTNIKGIFACGNTLHVHDLVDWAAQEGERAGSMAAQYSQYSFTPDRKIAVRAGSGVRYVLPHYLTTRKKVELSLRVQAPGRNRELRLNAEKRVIFAKELPHVHPAEMVQLEITLPPWETMRSVEVCVV